MCRCSTHPPMTMNYIFWHSSHDNTSIIYLCRWAVEYFKSPITPSKSTFFLHQTCVSYQHSSKQHRDVSNKLRHTLSLHNYSLQWYSHSWWTFCMGWHSCGPPTLLWSWITYLLTFIIQQHWHHICRWAVNCLKSLIQSPPLSPPCTAKSGELLVFSLCDYWEINKCCKEILTILWLLCSIMVPPALM